MDKLGRGHVRAYMSFFLPKDLARQTRIPLNVMLNGTKLLGLIGINNGELIEWIPNFWAEPNSKSVKVSRE